MVILKNVLILRRDENDLSAIADVTGNVKYLQKFVNLTYSAPTKEGEFFKNHYFCQYLYNDVLITL